MSPEITADAVADVTAAVRWRSDAEASGADELVGLVPDDAEVVLQAWSLVRLDHACCEKVCFV